MNKYLDKGNYMLSLNRIGGGLMLLKQVYGQNPKNQNSNKTGILKSSTPITKNILPTNNQPKNR